MCMYLFTGFFFAAFLLSLSSTLTAAALTLRSDGRRELTHGHLSHQDREDILHEAILPDFEVFFKTYMYG